MIERVYDDDGVYLGVVYRQGDWVVAEDRLAVTRRHRSEAAARAWPRVRRADTLPPEPVAA